MCICVCVSIRRCVYSIYTMCAQVLALLTLFWTCKVRTLWTFSGFHFLECGFRLSFKLFWVLEGVVMRTRHKYESTNTPQFFSVKSLQIPRTIAGTNSASPVNSLVKKVWLSFGSDDIALRSSRGAQATPTAYMVMPNDWWVGQTGRVKEVTVRCEHILLLFLLEFNTHLASVQPSPVLRHHHRICHPSPQLESCGLALSAWGAQRKKGWILLRETYPNFWLQ